MMKSTKESQIEAVLKDYKEQEYFCFKCSCFGIIVLILVTVFPARIGTKDIAFILAALNIALPLCGSLLYRLFVTIPNLQKLGVNSGTDKDLVINNKVI